MYSVRLPSTRICSSFSHNYAGVICLEKKDPKYKVSFLSHAGIPISI